MTQSDRKESDVITFAEAAEIIGVHRSQVGRWAKENLFEHWYTPGGSGRLLRKNLPQIEKQKSLRESA